MAELLTICGPLFAAGAKGSPTTAAPVKHVANAGSLLNYVGWTSNGQSVNGNSHWYRSAEGDDFWAGATDRSIPGL